MWQLHSLSRALPCSASLHTDARFSQGTDEQTEVPRRQEAVGVTQPITPALSQLYPLLKPALMSLTHLLVSITPTLPWPWLQEKGLWFEACGARFHGDLRTPGPRPHPGTFTLRAALQEERSHLSPPEETGDGPRQSQMVPNSAPSNQVTFPHRHSISSSPK